MRLMKEKTLKHFAAKHASAANLLANFASQVKVAKWSNMNEVVQSLLRPSPLSAERVVFDLGGNKWRLICNMDFERGVVYVKWFGSHQEYDDIDAHSATNAV